MEGLANKWKAMLQSQSAEENKFSRLTNSRYEEQNIKIKQPEVTEEAGKGQKHRQQRQKTSKQEKNKQSRTKSSEQRKLSASKNDKTSVMIAETPNKSIDRKKERLVDGYTSTIMELIDEDRGPRLRPKIKSLLQDLIMNVQTETNLQSSLKIGIGDRAYHQLQQKYLESQRERQYLRGKTEMSTKRYEGLERQLERYSKMEKLIDNSINRENELRQEISRLQAQRTQLQSQMQIQNERYTREVASIRALVESLKMNLPFV